MFNKENFDDYRIYSIEMMNYEYVLCHYGFENILV
jgi:hypothetical protein